MKNYYAEFLEIKKTGNTLGDSVSKVSEGQKLSGKETFDTFDTDLSSTNHETFISEANPRETINRMIAAGASFDVSTNGFQIFGADNLTELEKNFLTDNKAAILCTLQQGLLVKHLFSEKPELKQTFVSKIEERGASFEAVCGTSAKWFARLLDTMPDRKTND